MRSKKPRAKTAKPLLRGKRIGLTSAIGPKATTAAVVVVLAGGIWFGSHQRLAAKAKTPAAAVDTTAEFTVDPASVAKTPAVAHDAGGSHPSDASAPSKSPKVPVTTFEGCLERNGDGFHLKNTSGANAPKSRSWKSGFLKKSSATIDVVDASESLGLANRVGTRVSVTGVLVDHEMQARSIHRVSSSCN